MIPQKWTLAIVLSAVLVFFVVENLIPLRERRRPLFHRVLINLLFSVTTFAAAGIFVKPAFTYFSKAAAENSFGIIPLLPLPDWALWALSFFLLDLTFYYWHRLNHVIPFLWRFHNVHHMDPDLDTSTGFRFHFGEVAMSSIFRSAQALVLGVPLSIFAVYEFVFQLEAYFHHSNIRLPLLFERLLHFICVTPRYHGIHHSQVHNETDSNYGVVFTFWDRIHGTLKWAIPSEKIHIGVPGYDQPEDNRFWKALLFPFQKPRNYWLGNETRTG